jgi:glycosyltransferase involved in cell wall biosynthesis
MNKTFSIITITKNSLPELKRTFESLKKQTVKDFEWIVTDGNSIDGTAKWLNDIESCNFECKYTSKNDNGISDAWNTGIKAASGDQILILNAGDTYDKDMIAIFKKNINNDKITCSHARLINPATKKKVGIFKAEPKKLWRGMHLPHNWCSVPKIFYKEFGFYPPTKYAMDFNWFHKVFKKNGAEAFQLIDLVLGSFYLGGVSDKQYIKSFFSNRGILIENGTHNLLATLLCVIYVTKHKINKIINFLK